MKRCLLRGLRDRFIYARSSKERDLTRLRITGDDLIQFVIPFLNANPMITTLDVRHNESGGAGAAALAGNQTLTTLDVSDNQIGDAGRNALLQAYQRRVDNYKNEKWGFLSVMTLTNSSHLESSKRVANEKTLNAEKQKTMLFKFRKGANKA